ncbi:hypothetical protein [Holdemania massiliensis]|uniref:hypothetical protein n=1 Tax=Holdemania massiliensis TaxID=1468449 RepID=UPI001F06D21E|nr:hypothetical protein [Holdemania massiliensis]MCH1942157.1 hypothetical protein [Holdemania massiliensis]
MKKKHQSRRWGWGIFLISILLSTQTLQAEDPTPTPLPSAPSEQKDLALGDKESDDSLSTEFNGTVRASLLSATLPAAVGFTYDPAAAFDPTRGENQVSTPAAFAATNNSPVPVVLEITAVSVPDPLIGENPLDHSQQIFSLVQSVDEVQQPGSAILAVRPRGETYASLSEFEKFALDPEREASDPLRMVTIPTDRTIPLEIWGKFASDRFYGEYGVKVKITLKIRALMSGEDSDYVPESGN